MPEFEAREKEQYVDAHRNFCKALILCVVFVFIIVFFAIQRGFSQKEWQYLSAGLSFIYFNFLVYTSQLSGLLIKNRLTAHAPAAWLVGACIPLFNLFVITRLFSLSGKLQKAMQVERIPWDARSLRKRNSLTMIISFGIVISVLQWFAVSKVSVVDSVEKLRRESRAGPDYQGMFREAAQLMNQGEFYQGLKKLRHSPGMPDQEQERYDQLVKNGYQGHAFVLSEKALVAIKSGDSLEIQNSLNEYKQWMNIYSEKMGIPKDKMGRLVRAIVDIQDVFPPHQQASLKEKRDYCHAQVDSLLLEEPAGELLKSFVDVLLFDAVRKAAPAPAL